MKSQVWISGCFENLSFRHGFIGQNFNQESDNFVIINNISKWTTLLWMFPNLRIRRHFDTRNTFKIFRMLNSGCLKKLSFVHGTIVELYKLARGNLDTIKDISKQNNLLLTISNLCERRHFDTLNTLKNVQIRIWGFFKNLNGSHGCDTRNLKHA